MLRYGDEIGMGDDLGLPERNCARTPMQWSTEPHGGFTTADKPVVPVISEGPYGYQHVNAAEQRRDPNSMLNWTERIVRMRKEVPEIGWGEFEVLPIRDPAVLAMRYDWRNNSVLFVHNLVGQPAGGRVLHRPAPAREGRVLVNLLTENHSNAPPTTASTVSARGVRVSLVSRRRARLPAQAQRHRDARPDLRAPTIAQGCGTDRRTSPGVRASVRLNAFAKAASDV